MHNMKYFLVLLAVAAVFAQHPIDISFEDKQQGVGKFTEDLDLETLTNKVDEAVIPSTTNLCSINVPALTTLINGLIDKKIASQPGRSKIYKMNICIIVHLFICSCADALSFHCFWKCTDNS